jgi:hypothetical protein
MKRLIAAVSFAVLAVPAVAAENGKPFEQLDLDRALPQIEFPAVERSNVDARSLPYEQAQVDRALPSFRGENVRFAAAGGGNVSDASIATDASSAAGTTESPWANDWNFIAPAP